MRHNRSGRRRKDSRIAVSVRLDLRYLAGIASYLTKGGIVIRNKSDLTHLATEALHTILVQRGLIREFTSYSDAVEYLEDMGLHYRDSDRKGVAELLSRDSLQEVANEFDQPEDDAIRKGLAMLGRMNMDQAREVVYAGGSKQQKEEKKAVLPGTGSGVAPMIPDKVRKVSEK